MGHKVVSVGWALLGFGVHGLGYSATPSRRSMCVAREPLRGRTSFGAHVRAFTQTALILIMGTPQKGSTVFGNHSESFPHMSTLNPKPSLMSSVAQP